MFRNCRRPRKIKGGWELYNSKGDFGEIEKKRKYGNLKNVADFEGERDNSTSEGKGGEMKNSQGKIRKLKKKKDIGKWEFGGLIVDLSKSQHGLIRKSADWMMSFEREKVLMGFLNWDEMWSKL